MTLSTVWLLLDPLTEVDHLSGDLNYSRLTFLQCAIIAVNSESKSIIFGPEPILCYYDACGYGGTYQCQATPTVLGEQRPSLRG